MGDVVSLTDKQLHEKWAVFDNAARELCHAYLDYAVNYCDGTRQGLFEASCAFTNAFDDYTDLHFKTERVKNGDGGAA
jgi:hypothetical protein